MVQVMPEEGVIFCLTNYFSNAIVLLKNEIENILMVEEGGAGETDAGEKNRRTPQDEGSDEE